jgi:hypothetical protein
MLVLPDEDDDPDDADELAAVVDPDAADPEAAVVSVLLELPHPASRLAPITALAAAAITLLNLMLPPCKSSSEFCDLHINSLCFRR